MKTKTLEELGVSPALWTAWAEKYELGLIMESDASLIAAAPERYEALCKVVELFGSTSEHEESILHIARAAHEKAGGAE